MQLPSEQQRIIQKLDKLVNESIARIETSLTPAEKEVYELVSDFVGSLQKTNGKLTPSIKNLNQVQKFRNQLTLLLDSGIYGKQVKDFLQTFVDSGSLINSYFAAMSVDFSASSSLFKAILQANVDTTLESLLGAGMQAAYKEPVITLLTKSIAGNSSIIDLRKALQQQLISSPDYTSGLTRHVKQVASDSLEQFTRNYMQSISNDLGLEHYLYAGTEINSTRSFCKERTGKLFTKAQVEKMSTLDWGGKIPATNKQTIFQFAGGYACRHRFLPVTKEYYEKQNT